MRSLISESEGTGPTAGANASNRATGRPREVITTSSPLLAFRRYTDSRALNSRTDAFMRPHYNRCSHMARGCELRFSRSGRLNDGIWKSMFDAVESLILDLLPSCRPIKDRRRAAISRILPASPCEAAGRSAEPAINRAGLINHDLASADVTSHALRQLDAQHVSANKPGRARKDPGTRMIRLVQQVGLDDDHGPDLAALRRGSHIEARQRSQSSKEPPGCALGELRN